MLLNSYGASASTNYLCIQWMFNHAAPFLYTFFNILLYVYVDWPLDDDAVECFNVLLVVAFFFKTDYLPTSSCVDNNSTLKKIS